MNKFNLEWTYAQFIDPAQISCSGTGTAAFHLRVGPLRTQDSVVEPSFPHGRMKTADVCGFGASAGGSSKLLRKQSVTPLHFTTLCAK